MSSASANASYHRHSDRITADRRYRYKNDPEFRAQCLSQCAAYRSANREKVRAANKVWRDANPGSAKKGSLKFHYGISVEEHEALRLKQDNKCASCGWVFDGTKLLGPFVDHDHATGKVRALLCHKCNTALGLMGEDANKLIALSSYIKQHQIT